MTVIATIIITNVERAELEASALPKRIAMQERRLTQLGDDPRSADASEQLVELQESLKGHYLSILLAHDITPPEGSTITRQNNGDGTEALVVSN